MVNCLAIKRNELLIQAVIWMILENMLSIKGHIECDFIYMTRPEQACSRLVVAGAGGAVGMEVTANGQGSLFR